MSEGILIWLWVRSSIRRRHFPLRFGDLRFDLGLFGELYNSVLNSVDCLGLGK